MTGQEVQKGQPFPLGVAVDPDGANFAVRSEVADAVEICLFGPDGAEICGSHYPVKVLLRSKRLSVAFDVDNNALSVVVS